MSPLRSLLRSGPRLLALMGLTACAPDLTEACATTDQPALRISVKSITGDICDAVVVATSSPTPGFTETLRSVDCVYEGATERPGSYKVTIAAQGFQTKTIWPVAGEDDCGHVAPKSVIVLLIPDAPAP
jgi:hypothetical protein